MADDDSAASTSAAEGRTIGDWTAYLDDDGRTYYHNETSGETTWDAPPGFAEEGAADDADDDNGGAGGGAQASPLEGAAAEVEGDAKSPAEGGIAASPAISAAADGDGITKSPPSFDAEAAAEPAAEEAEEADEDAADGEDVGGGWMAYKDPDNEGRAYYYHAESGETQWERPDVGETTEAGDSDSVVGALTPRSPPEEEMGAAEGMQLDEEEEGASPLGGGTSPQEEGDVSPSKQWADDKMDVEPSEGKPKHTAAEAEAFLQRPDAVMEPAVVEQINVLVRELGPQVAGPKALQSLTTNYGGAAAASGLMGRWLAELRAGGGESGTEGNGNNNGGSIGGSVSGAADPLFEEGAHAARSIAADAIGRLVRDHFTKEHGDAILGLKKGEAGFVEDMIRSERWRKLLIDLSATHKESKLFAYCLRKISSLGHHRDIAGRIDQSEYFEVFGAMLGSELSIAARVAVDGCTTEVAAAIDLTEGAMGGLVADLRRTCTSASFTYLYAMEVLERLIAQTKEMLASSGDDDGSQRQGLARAVRKWERLREELEDEMLAPTKAGTTFQRKRRVDAALTMGELFQRKRKRKAPANDGVDGSVDGGSSSSHDDLADALDAALMQLLTKSSLDVPLDKEVAENVLKYAYGGSTDRIGDLLVRHPAAVTALLRALFGAKRVRQLETRLKCARLVALAVTASERLARSESGNADMAVCDEDALSEAILKGSQLCERLENMVSFTVVDEAHDAANGSVGRQLSALCIQHPVVAQGALMWAREFAGRPDFAETASYPTISPCILSLARLISRHHPLARPAILDIALIFMGHSNREISHQKMASIKEQCLRLMLWLCTQGLSLAVLSAVRRTLEKGGSSEMDSALLRYFVGGVLDIARPPYSMAFVRALGQLMAKRPCVDALLSNHFEASKRERIVGLIQDFKKTAGVWKEACEEDETLLATLKGTYCSPNN